MANSITISDGTTTPQATMDPGDLLVLAPDATLDVDGAPAVTLADPFTALTSDGLISATGAPAVLIEADDTQVTIGAIDPNAAVLSDGTAVRVDAESAQINNLGTIDGAFNGVNFANGGETSGKLFNNGLITSASRAVNIGGDGIVVLNHGVIETTADPRNGVVYSDTTADDYDIVNTVRGVIAPVEGTNGDAISLQLGEDVTLSVTNKGLATGRGEPDGGGQASGLRLFAGVDAPSYSGSILNHGDLLSEATTGIGAGLLIEDGLAATGQIANFGTIAGPRNGLYLGDGDYADLVVLNGESGSITSDSRAVNIDGEGLTFVNEGQILGTGDSRNGVVYTDVTATGFTIENTATGVIDGGEVNIGTAISLEIGALTEGFVQNHGLVQGRGEASGILIDAPPSATGIFKGDIVNSGAIASEGTGPGTAGILTGPGAGLDGAIVNTGEIFGPFNGISLTGPAAGTTIRNEGLIASDSRAVDIATSSVELFNHGHILGTADSRNGVVYQDDSASEVAIANGAEGVIDAGEGNNGDAISIEAGAGSTATVSNHGHVQARGEAALAGQASGVRVFANADTPTATFTGTITNSGKIATEAMLGVSAGILIQDDLPFTGEILNTGEIIGPRNGVYVGDGDHELKLVNEGTIASDSRAVNIGGDGVTLVNDGLILGTDDSRNGVVYVDDEAEQFVVHNRAHGVVDAGEGNDGHAISVELGAAATGLIETTGLLLGRGESAGIRLFSNPETAPAGSIFTGHIVVDGIVETEAGPGLLIDPHVAVESADGGPAVLLLGDVDGSPALDATAMTTGLDLAHAGGTVDGDLLFGSGNDVVSLGDEAFGGGGTIDGDVVLGAGDDVVYVGSADVDGKIELGAGHDLLDAVEATSDLVVHGGPGSDEVFAGAGDDVIAGGDGPDLLYGYGGDDEIAGDAGADVLVGGAGLDFLTGGDDADLFVFGPDSDVDVVLDFDASEGDLIDLTAFGFADAAAVLDEAVNLAGNFVLGDEQSALVLLDVEPASLGADAFIV